MSLRITPPNKGSILTHREGSPDQNADGSPSQQQSQERSEEPAVISDITGEEPDETEQQFRRTCQKIREIEERARHAHRMADIQQRCSFCGRSRSAVGQLCQPEQVDVYICRECAESAVAMLKG